MSSPTLLTPIQVILVKAHICVLDLGSAIDISARPLPRHGRVCTQAYRAPEVTLGKG